MQIKIHYSPVRRSYELWAFKDGQRLEAVGLKFIEDKDWAYPHEPPVLLSPETAQALADALFEAGIRANGSDGDTANGSDWDTAHVPALDKTPPWNISVNFYLGEK